MLAAEIAWNPESHFDTFLHRLSEVVKDELAAQELPMDLNSLITLTIRIYGLLSERMRPLEGALGYFNYRKVIYVQ